ncbi:MAG: branched-chain amino acid ABC transporter permease [Paracoccaceae bacterium]|nr:branched-chain amino acid ABC transporter permease [Paracoccaceae bacterium]
MSGLIIFGASVLTLAGIYAILAIILNLEAGWGGLWDLGTAGLLATGCYVYVILTVHSEEIAFAPQLPIWAGIIGASLFTGFLAFLIGLPSLKMRGEYFLITTFAFSVVVLEFITTESQFTMGATGIHDINRPFDGLVSTRNYNILLLGIVLVVCGLVWWLVRQIGWSPYGRLLRAARDNEAAALSTGKNIAHARLQAFVIAGLLIGAVAPLYVWYIRSISPHLFHATLTFTVWTALVIGGIGSLRGPVLGAFLLIILTEATQFLQFSAEYARMLSASRPILVGLGLILIMRLRPEGLLPEARSFVNARTRLGGNL